MRGDAADAMAVARVDQGILLTGGVANATLNINNHGAERRRPRTLLEALDFPSRGYRENTVENAHGRTCEWLLENKQYRTWVASRNSDKPKHRLLWIKGKAGSGKSTIMKYALKNSRKKLDAKSLQKAAADGMMTTTLTYFQQILGAQPANYKPKDMVLSHFFNARSKVHLDKSVEGMYRTLLIQLLKRVPRLQVKVSDFQEDWLPPEGLPWPIPKLEELLSTAIANFKGRPIVFYVDALDECDTQEIRQMVRFFTNLVKKSASLKQIVRVCFASRPYPHHTSRGAVYMDLSLVEEHKRDIAAYVDSHLQIGSDSAAKKARRRLLRMAKGVFLWVKLVVNKLNEEHGVGRPDLYARWLSGAHGELRLLYEDMLERGMSAVDTDVQENSKQATVVCFQVFLSRAEQLSSRQLFYTIEQALNGDDKGKPPSHRTMDEEMVRRYISSISAGLLECVNQGPFEQVQFVHESAQSYMSSKDGLARLMELETPQDTYLPCQELMRTICERVLNQALLHRSQIESCLELEAWTAENYGARLADDIDEDYRNNSPNQEHLPEDFLEEHPMFPYARRSILHHTDEVQRYQSIKQDQSIWLVRAYATHGHKLMERLWQIYSSYIPARTSLIDFMVMTHLDSLMSVSELLLLENMRQSRQQRRAPGIWFGVGPDRRWTYVGLCDFGLRDFAGTKQHVPTAQCLVNLYLKQLESTARPDSIQEILGQLAATWKLEQGVPVRWADESGISLADVSDELALFFLIALVPADKFNESVIETITKHASAGFADTMLVFLESGIPTDYLVLDDPVISSSYLYWAEAHQHSALAAVLRNRGIRRGSETSQPIPGIWGAPQVSWGNDGSWDSGSEISAESGSVFHSSETSDE